MISKKYEKNEYLKDYLTDKNQFLGFENFAMVDTSQNLAMGSSQFEFAEPMVFDLIGRLGAIPGEREIKYLMIIPLNGEPIEFVPEYEQVTSIKLITYFRICDHSFQTHPTNHVIRILYNLVAIVKPVKIVNNHFKFISLDSVTTVHWAPLNGILDNVINLII
jgi:hypothetical protein